MINLNTYITEKLKINKDIKLDDVSSKIEEDLIEYLHQYKSYNSKWDTKVGETLKDWVKKYNVDGIKVYAPLLLISKVENIKLNQDFIDKVISSKEWDKIVVYKSNHTRVFNSNTKNLFNDYISIWYDEEGYELRINEIYVLLKKLNVKEI